MKKAIKYLLGIGALVVAGIFEFKRVSKIIKEKDEKIHKFKDYYNVLNQWMKIKNEASSLEEYFKKRGYSTIAIYGMGEIGCRLYEELENTSINVSYVIDKEAESKYSSIRIIDISNKLDDVDVIVVTPIFDFENIKIALEEKTDIKVISFEDVIYEYI